MFNNFPVLKGFFLFVFLLMSSVSFSQTYCASNGNNTSDEYIGNVQLNTINNNSGAGTTSTGYSNFTAISTTLNLNSSYTITITPFWTGTVYREGYAVWIDYNQDGNFTAGEQVFTQGRTTVTPVSGLFTIPNSATLGTTRMRVSMKYNDTPTSCETFSYGEVEDYTINITCAPISNNTFDLKTGIFGTTSATAVENANATLTAPAGKSFIYVGFASYGNPTGTSPNFAIGGCHATTSQSVAEGYLLGNSTATIPATNAIFGDPCVGTVKSLYVLASHAAPICAGTSPGIITGTTPTGGNGTYTYLWESSTTSATSGFVNAAGTNNQISYTPGSLTQTTWYRRVVTSCSYTSISATIKIAVNPLPTAPTTTGGQICIGSTATLSASGAGAGSVYKWYSAAAAGTLLKTSTNNTDNTYVTPTIAITTNYWVAILNASGCESARTIVAATFPTLSTDSQTTAGTNTWIGHVYDGTNSGVAYNGSFTNYYGSVTKAETFDENFGGNTTCYVINSTTPLQSRSIYTETFSVRYRMNSTKQGLYVVDLGSDDGTRLQVDGTLIYSEWSDHGFNSRPRVLMSLNGSSSLVYDFYENTVGNRVIFNNLVKILDNSLSTNTTQNICTTSTGLAISGDTFGTLPTGISLSGTGYQWAYSTSVTGPWTNISGATAATFTPSGLTPEFSAGGTFYVIRKAILSSTNNIGMTSPFVQSNNSNIATITIISNSTWSGIVSADWNNAANWSCGGVPTSTTDVIIPAGTPHDPIIYISPDANGFVKNMELQSGATLTIRDNYIQIAGAFVLNGFIDLVGEAQLIQTTTSTLHNASTGYIEVDQQGQGNKFRYNDWSSPVIKTGTVSGTPFSISDVLRDGTNPSAPGPIVYTFGYDGATSPLTLSEFWMYKYTSSLIGWNKIGSTGALNPGEGFLMKGTGNPGSPDQNYVFEGKPNNGVISFSINPSNDYLVGNPYPSALDANKFIDDNTPSGTGSSITGTLYFWEHYGGDSHILKEYQVGYGSYTKASGVPATAGALAGVSSSGTPVKTPQRYIPIGQGFFVIGDADGGTVEFNNGQRVFETETSGNSIFMKAHANKTTSSSKTTADVRPKFRVGFDGASISHRQILFTVDENTSDAVDWGYEAEIYEIFEDDMFWMINDKKYVIQASNNVDINKEIALGIKSSGGQVSIKIDALENVDGSTELYIKDNVTGLTHSIKNQNFEITLPKGEYLNRFSLVFKTQNTLGVEEEILNDGILVFMNNASSELKIRKSIANTIESVQLYNNLGQLIKTWKTSFNGEEFNLPINESTGLYFVKINTDIGILNKKIIIE